MAESSHRYNLRNTKKKPQGALLKRWEVEYSNLINNENRRIPLETVKTAIHSAFEDGMFEQWRITLKCPLSGQRIKVPARYTDCTHIECFDLEAFLRMKMQKNLRVCPICQKEVEKPLANLRIDKYIETVLSTLPDAMQVELLPDGSFIEVHEELVEAPNVINDEEPYVQDSNEPAVENKQEAIEDDDECITLSDSDEEVIEMKPISLMPLNMDIKPKIASSPEQEQTNSGEDQEIQTDNDSTDNSPEQNLSQILEDDSLTTSVVDGQQQQHGFGNSSGESAADVEEIEYDLECEMEETRTNKARADSKMEEKRFKCKVCSYSTKYKYHLLIHCRTHTGEKPFKCTQCSYASVRARDLKTHMRTHTGEKPYKCTQCSYASATASHLKVHMRTHTGEKPYQCSQCSYASAQSSALKSHMRTKESHMRIKET